MTSRCFGWAGFQMLRFAQHDSSMSDFAGLRSGGILDALRWHDRLITKTHLCKSELTFSSCPTRSYLEAFLTCG